MDTALLLIIVVVLGIRVIVQGRRLRTLKQRLDTNFEARVARLEALAPAQGPPSVGPARSPTSVPVGSAPPLAPVPAELSFEEVTPRDVLEPAPAPSALGAVVEEAAPRRCPRCRVWSPAGTSSCICGFVFPSLRDVDRREVAAPAETRETLHPVVESLEPELAAGFELSAWLRTRLPSEEWEAVVGGSWLNKLGVLVLVIGLALFLGYSLGHLGPWGKIAVGFFVSGAMLVSGIVLERRARYVIFARGMIGGGWAALYFTTYAAHGLDATRVVQDSRVAMLLLATAAAGLILHSLRYRSETVTGLAYVVGFVTVAIGPASHFSLLASLPLAASLLVVAWRFSWTTMAVGGVVATYSTYAIRYGAPSPAPGDFLGGQAVLAAYWLLFEAFDLLGLARARERRGMAQTIFPLNTCGFLGVSLLQWSQAQPETLAVFLGGAAAVYVASALIRSRLSPWPASPADVDAAVGARLVGGGHEAALTVAFALLTPAILLRFSGFNVNLALLLEAELLFFAGLGLGQPYLRALAGAALLLSVGKLVLVDLARGAEQVIGGVAVLTWVPLGLLTAAVLFLNRGFVRAEHRALVLAPERGYSYAASALVALILGFQSSPAARGLAWLAAAAPLYEFGLRRQLQEFRLQAYGLAVLGFIDLFATRVLGLGLDPSRLAGPSLGAGALLAYGLSARLFRSRPAFLPGWERESIRDAASVVGTTMLAAALWHVLPPAVVALAWATLALLLIELDLARTLPLLRLQGHVMAAVTLGRLLLANFTGIGETLGISHRILTVGPVILLAYYLAGRLQADERADPRARALARGYLYAAAVLAVLLVRFEAGRVLAVAGWALLGLGFLVIGIRQDQRDFRWQSYVLAVLTFARSWSTNFYIPESLGGTATRVATAGIVIACFYASLLLCPRRLAAGVPVSGRGLERVLGQLDQHARPLFAMLATLLLSVLLLYEVSGNLLTVAWGLEGIMLALLGFALRERSLRLAALVLLGVCIVKLFAYDMRQMETIFRILSFIVLGLVLLGVSLVYTRYREQLHRYL